ncbi:MAG: helix-turn-helix domain-containing protein [Ferruginibacter sp.]
MPFDFNLYSGLLIPFFVQGILFSIILFVRGKQEEKLSDTLLGWLLLLNAIKIAFWMLGFAGWYDTHDAYSSFMFYFPFNNVLWMGPLLYFYLLSLTNTEFVFQKKHYRHFILPVLFLGMIIVKFIVDFAFNRPFPVEELTQYGTKGPLADLDKNIWIDVFSYGTFFYYLYISIKAYRGYQVYIKQNFSSTEEIRFDWMRNLLYAIAGGVIVFFIFSLIQRFVEIRRSYVFEWYAYVALGIVIYYLSIAGYFARPGHRQQLLFVPVKEKVSEQAYLEKEKLPELEAWKEKLARMMEEQKPYLEPELNLTQLARLLNTNPSFLSKLINEGIGQNFNDYINDYRVKAVIEKLMAGEQKAQTLLGIAFDCGFNSKATFNRAFKKIAGTSPREWLDKNISSNT